MTVPANVPSVRHSSSPLCDVLTFEVQLTTVTNLAYIRAQRG